MVAVQKGTDRWEIACDKTTTVEGDLEVGKQIAVTYHMVSPSMYGPFKTYSVKGPLLEVRDDMVAVQKGPNRWEIARDSLTKFGRPGEPVTAYYKMIATSLVRKN